MYEDSSSEEKEFAEIADNALRTYEAMLTTEQIYNHIQQRDALRATLAATGKDNQTIVAGLSINSVALFKNGALKAQIDPVEAVGVLVEALDQVLTTESRKHMKERTFSMRGELLRLKERTLPSQSFTISDKDKAALKEKIEKDIEEMGAAIKAYNKIVKKIQQLHHSKDGMNSPEALLAKKVLDSTLPLLIGSSPAGAAILTINTLIQVYDLYLSSELEEAGYQAETQAKTVKTAEIKATATYKDFTLKYIDSLEATCSSMKILQHHQNKLKQYFASRRELVRQPWLDSRKMRDILWDVSFECRMILQPVENHSDILFTQNLAKHIERVADKIKALSTESQKQNEEAFGELRSLEAFDRQHGIMKLYKAKSAKRVPGKKIVKNQVPSFWKNKKSKGPKLTRIKNTSNLFDFNGDPELILAGSYREINIYIGQKLVLLSELMRYFEKLEEIRSPATPEETAIREEIQNIYQQLTKNFIGVYGYDTGSEFLPENKVEVKEAIEKTKKFSKDIRCDYRLLTDKQNFLKSFDDYARTEIIRGVASAKEQKALQDGEILRQYLTSCKEYSVLMKRIAGYKAKLEAKEVEMGITQKKPKSEIPKESNSRAIRQGRKVKKAILTGATKQIKKVKPRSQAIGTSKHKLENLRALIEADMHKLASKEEIIRQCEEGIRALSASSAKAPLGQILQGASATRSGSAEHKGSNSESESESGFDKFLKDVLDEGERLREGLPIEKSVLENRQFERWLKLDPRREVEERAKTMYDLPVRTCTERKKRQQSEHEETNSLPPGFPPKAGS